MTTKTSVQQQWNIVEPYTAPDYIVYSQALVDNEPWYTVKCSKDAASWVREQDTRLWYEHVDPTWHTKSYVYDMHQELLVMLKLSWA